MSDQSFDVYCPRCNIQVEAPVIASGHGGFQSKAASALGEVDAEYHGDVFYVALCRRCKEPFLIRQSLYGIPGEFETITSEEVLYPISSRFPLEGVPEATRRSYNQAVRCYSSSSFDACALMCRRSLEALCKEFAVTTGSLQTKLDTLFKQSVIDSRLVEWAHSIRAVGNEAAHDTDTELSQDDAKDALDFTEAILMYVFVLGSRFTTFAERRKKSSSS